ncbi:AtaL-like protein [Actinophytocola sp.]|uniref:AtaL-like protein n=1 Tax=Actinophytocola sp. TaxID=1872138 RepID=UPI002ED0EDC8
MFTHTVPIGLFPDENAPDLLDQLWTILVHKAENPVGYVPAITEAKVIEHYPDGFLREIVVRGKDRYRERVTLVPNRRVVFDQLDDPLHSLITNELGRSADGGYTYTLCVTLSPEGLARAQQEPSFLWASDTIFFDTARASANSLRLTAERAEG